MQFLMLSLLIIDRLFVLLWQLQLWLENPLIQLTFKNSITQIEAPYNGSTLFLPLIHLIVI